MGLLEAIARTLVEHREEVRVRAVQGRAITVLELQVHPEDIGKVIGHDGRIAEAFRMILRAAGRKLNRRVKVEILDLILASFYRGNNGKRRRQALWTHIRGTVVTLGANVAKEVTFRTVPTGS